LRRALLIANSSYEDSRIQTLASPIRDAESLAAVLADPGIGNFDVDLVRDAGLRTVQINLEQAVRVLRPPDTLLVYFSGHGAPARAEGGLLYCVQDTDPELLLSTSLRGSMLRELLDQTLCQRIIVVFDCCFSGAMTSDFLAKEILPVNPEYLAARGRAVLMSSTSVQTSLEFNDTELGWTSVFTRGIVEGIETGGADLDRDGLITVDELFQYTVEWVQARAPAQTPVMSAFDVDGRLLVARAPKPELQVLPIPESLVAAARNEYRGVRHAAVEELELFLSSALTPRAVQARDLLLQLAKDPDQTVSSRARAALDRRELKPIAEPAREVPGFSVSLDGPMSVTVHAGELKSAIDACVLVASRDTSRPALAGTFIHFDGTRLRLVATDSYRLLIQDIPAEPSSAFSNNLSGLVLAASLASVPVKSNTETANIIFGPLTVEIEAGGHVFAVDQLDADFPDYEVFLRRYSPTGGVTVDAGLLGDAVDRAASAVKDDPTPVMLRQTLLGISVALAPDVTSVIADIPIRSTIEEGLPAVAFNVSFLRDGVRLLGTGDIEILSSPNNGACTLRPIPAGDRTYWLMPVKVSTDT
jgi:DNA polymerase III sliding clamp (beta) subunit (PCNA family)